MYEDILHVFTGTVRFVQSDPTKDAWLQIWTFLAVPAADVAEVVDEIVVLVVLAVVPEGVNDAADVVAESAPALVVASAVAVLAPLLFRWLSPTPSPTPSPIARTSTNPMIMPQNATIGRPATLLFRPVSCGGSALVGLYWLFFAYCSLYGGANTCCWPGGNASRPSPATAWGRSCPLGAISGP